MQSLVWKTFRLSFSNKYGHICLKFLSLTAYHSAFGDHRLSKMLVSSQIGSGYRVILSWVTSHLQCPSSWEHSHFLCLFVWIEQVWYFASVFYGKNLCMSFGLYTGIISEKIDNNIRHSFYSFPVPFCASHE